MKNFNIEYDNSNYNFICEYFNTRNGFKHVATLFINGVERSTATVYYINRTWERWDYQTACQKAIYQIISNIIERQKDIFKADHGYKKMTAQRQEEFDAFIKDYTPIKPLYKCYDKLTNNLY